MIYIKNLEDESYLKSYQESLKKRNFSQDLLNESLMLNEKRKAQLFEFESKKSHQNKVGQEIALKKRNKEEATKELAEMQELSVQLKTLEEDSQKTITLLEQKLAMLPNKCSESVPEGKGAEDNKIIKKVGEPPRLTFKAKTHDELGVMRGFLDFERASKVSGARFCFLLGAGARLERAIMNFMLDLHSESHGYKETLPPFIVNSKTMYGTGQFPKFQQDVFALANTDYYLIPTAEAPLTSFYAGEILNEKDLPQKFCGYSSCFRSEAGSYGQDTKGLIRQHQFEKVELMMYSHPDKSYEEHEKLTNHAEEVLKRLELPYQVALLCSGDMSFSAAKCYDLEVWLPGQSAYREISSCSNFEDFQARRANIRFKPEGGGKPQYVHTLNGSGLAIGRTLIAILENYQQEDGKIRVPQVLKKYLGTDYI